MNPASNEMPGISLPPPTEQQPSAPNGVPTESAAMPAAPERPLASPEIASGNAASLAAPIMPPPAMPAATATPTTAAPASQTADSSTTQLAISKVLKDDDLIEKEWVDKAKRIVEQTRNDPHQQSEELTLVKADYMKKHYNKTIKIEK